MDGKDDERCKRMNVIRAQQNCICTNRYTSCTEIIRMKPKMRCSVEFRRDAPVNLGVQPNTMRQSRTAARVEQSAL